MFGSPAFSFPVSQLCSSLEASADFSQPWEFSDVVLVVEEEKFHVHRCVLAMWSPVFSKMFTAQFKEQTADEIPLPGKKATEIKELLQVIYPSIGKQVHEVNYLFLLNLAKEYMMTKLTKMCESFLIGRLSGWNFHCLTLLDVAQVYELKELEKACVDRAKSMSFNELTQHELYDKINISNYQAIVKGKIGKMECDIRSNGYEIDRLNNNVKSLKSDGAKALKELESITAIIAFAVGRTTNSSGEFDSSVRCLRNEDKFKNLCGPLNSLHSTLERISR